MLVSELLPACFEQAALFLRMVNHSTVLDLKPAPTSFLLSDSRSMWELALANLSTSFGREWQAILIRYCWVSSTG